MHQPVIDHVTRIKRLRPDLFIGKRVLEIGSLDINGAVRSYFEDCEYLGIDLVYGKGVDLVMHGADVGAEFDVVISTEALEHDFRYEKRLTIVGRIASAFSCTCATFGRAEHGTAKFNPQDSPATNDYYGNIDPSEFIKHFKGWNYELKVEGTDLLFWGVKRGD